MLKIVTEILSILDHEHRIAGCPSDEVVCRVCKKIKEVKRMITKLKSESEDGK